MTKQYGRSGYTMFTDGSKQSSVFDEPLSLVLPRALILLLLWVGWTFAWAGVTYVGLADEYQFQSGGSLNFID
jgi:hypothetical protein